MIRLLLIGITRFLVGGEALWIDCEPSTRQRIYFANHGSHLDALLLWAALPPHLRRSTHPVAAADYWGKGPIRRYIALKVLNAVLVERKGMSRSQGGPLGPVKAKLDEGHSIIIFPEGTRAFERLPGAFKPGIFHLAEDYSNVEFVPVYLDNLRRALPKGSLFPVPISCVARFGAPLQFQPGETREAFLGRTRDAVIALS